MTSLIAKQVAKGAQQIAQQATKQVGEEPFEMLKAAGKQVTGVENAPPPKEPAPSVPGSSQVSEAEIKNLQEKDKAQSKAMYETLQKQIQAISAEKSQSQIQAKSSMEAQTTANAPVSKPLVEPSTRRSRNPIKGMAKKLADLGKRAEIRMPPSG